MTNLYRNLEEIDDELCLIMDQVAMIREMLQEGRQDEALLTILDLEDRFEDFLEIEDEEDDDGGEQAGVDGRAEDVLTEPGCDDVEDIGSEDFHDVVCHSLEYMAGAITALDARLTHLEASRQPSSEDWPQGRPAVDEEEPEEPPSDGRTWHKVGMLARQRGD